MADSEAKTVHVRVDGLVQGVGFRAFVVRCATDLGVRGFVRNTLDGAVEIEAQGPASVIERFVLDVRRGPRMARVDDMKLETLAGTRSYDLFDIRW